MLFCFLTNCYSSSWHRIHRIECKTNGLDSYAPLFHPLPRPASFLSSPCEESKTIYYLRYMGCGWKRYIYIYICLQALQSRRRGSNVKKISCLTIHLIRRLVIGHEPVMGRSLKQYLPERARSIIRNIPLGGVTLPPSTFIHRNTFIHPLWPWCRCVRVKPRVTVTDNEIKFEMTMIGKGRVT